MCEVAVERANELQEILERTICLDKLFSSQPKKPPSHIQVAD